MTKRATLLLDRYTVNSDFIIVSPFSRIWKRDIDIDSTIATTAEYKGGQVWNIGTNLPVTAAVTTAGATSAYRHSLGFQVTPTTLSNDVKKSGTVTIVEREFLAEVTTTWGDASALSAVGARLTWRTKFQLATAGEAVVAVSDGAVGSNYQVKIFDRGAVYFHA